MNSSSLAEIVLLWLCWQALCFFTDVVGSRKF